MKPNSNSLQLVRLYILVCKDEKRSDTRIEDNIRAKINHFGGFPRKSEINSLCFILQPSFVIAENI